LLLFAVACKAPVTSQQEDTGKQDASAAVQNDTEKQDDTGTQSETVEPEPTRPPKPEEPEYEPLPDELKSLAERIAGEWFADLAGFTIPLTLYEDGSYTLSFPGEAPQTGKWETADGRLLLDGNADDALVPVNGVLRWESAGLLFTRETPQSYVPAEVDADAKEGAFDGWWKAQFVGVGEGTILAQALEEDTELYIEGAKLALTGARFGNVILDGTIANGALTFTANGATVKLELLADGFLRLMLEGAEPAVLYLMRMATPEQASAENP